MENKISDERMAKIVELLRETDRKYVLITTSPEGNEAFIDGKGTELLSMFTYGLRYIAQSVIEQSKELPKIVILNEAADLRQAVYVITVGIESEAW